MRIFRAIFSDATSRAFHSLQIACFFSVLHRYMLYNNMDKASFVEDGLSFCWSDECPLWLSALRLIHICYCSREC